MEDCVEQQFQVKNMSNLLIRDHIKVKNMSSFLGDNATILIIPSGWNRKVEILGFPAVSERYFAVVRPTASTVLFNSFNATAISSLLGGWDAGIGFLWNGARSNFDSSFHACRKPFSALFLVVFRKWMPHKELALGTPMSRLSTVFHTRRLFLVLYSIFSLGLDSAGNRKRLVLFNLPSIVRSSI